FCFVDLAQLDLFFKQDLIPRTFYSQKAFSSNIDFCYFLAQKVAGVWGQRPHNKYFSFSPRPTPPPGALRCVPFAF
ncbi:MAG: hypothetical protein NC084_10780, partial [Bacteroides sp.]|nr:hypothetical protein [Roseburia sp.]MCM1463179.1 hypothetical protein [Bacteroides sp.]